MPSNLGAVASAIVPFNPLDYTPVLWLDAADTSTITSSSGDVSQWDDKSGNGYHVSQSTSAEQPKTGTLTLNGRNVIDFNGTSHRLIRETDTAIGRNVTGLTVYVVAKHDAQADNSTPVATAIGTANSNRIFLYYKDANSSMAFEGRTLDADTVQTVESAAGSFEDVWLSQIVVYDYADTAAYQYIDGVLDGSTSSYQTATTTSNTDSLRLTVGINASLTSSSRMDGQIAEIIIYHSAHTATERATVLDYLNGKWGL